MIALIWLDSSKDKSSKKTLRYSILWKNMLVRNCTISYRINIRLLSSVLDNRKVEKCSKQLIVLLKILSFQMLIDLSTPLSQSIKGAINQKIRVLPYWAFLTWESHSIRTWMLINQGQPLLDSHSWKLIVALAIIVNLTKLKTQVMWWQWIRTIK